jgi:hypothetical protein
LLDGSFLWDVAHLYRFWRHKGCPSFATSVMLEHFLCAFLRSMLKKPSRGPKGPESIPDDIVDADRNIRLFCERVSAGRASSPFALEMARYDRRHRSAGPLLPEAFLDHIESNSKAYSVEIRSQRRAGRRSQACAAKSGQRAEVSDGMEDKP